MHRLKSCCVLVLAGFLGIVTQFPNGLASPATDAGPANDAAGLVQALARQDPDSYFDYHGNANAELQRLQVLRFDATATIMSSIDQMQGDPARAQLVAALYRVLGFSKDPMSTGWLEAKLRSPQHDRIHEQYMVWWHDGIGYGFGNNQGFGGWPWLTGRERWVTFFITAHAIEADPDRRVELMNVLKGFDEAAAMQFFLAQRTSTTDPREVLLVEAYLHQHDLPADGGRISAAIDALRADPDTRQLLIGTADALQHEAVVPYLLSVQFDPQADAVLKNTTFELDVEGEPDWRAWYARHRSGTRRQWVDAAINAFRQRLNNDPAEALDWFSSKASYRWNDVAALGLVREELLPRREFASAIAGWINMSYSEFRRPAFIAIANELARHPQDLEDWARNLLIERRLLAPTRPPSWEEYVRRSNMRL